MGFDALFPSVRHMKEVIFSKAISTFWVTYEHGGEPFDYMRKEEIKNCVSRGWIFCLEKGENDTPITLPIISPIP